MNNTRRIISTYTVPSYLQAQCSIGIIEQDPAYRKSYPEGIVTEIQVLFYYIEIRLLNIISFFFRILTFQFNRHTVSKIFVIYLTAERISPFILIIDGFPSILYAYILTLSPANSVIISAVIFICHRPWHFLIYPGHTKHVIFRIVGCAKAVVVVSHFIPSYRSTSRNSNYLCQYIIILPYSEILFNIIVMKVVKNNF